MKEREREDGTDNRFLNLSKYQPWKIEKRSTVRG